MDSSRPIFTLADYGHSCDLWLYTASGGEWLEFDTERDAVWAKRVWEGFVRCDRVA